MKNIKSVILIFIYIIIALSYFFINNDKVISNIILGIFIGIIMFFNLKKTGNLVEQQVNFEKIVLLIFSLFLSVSSVSLKTINIQLITIIVLRTLVLFPIVLLLYQGISNFHLFSDFKRSKPSKLVFLCLWLPMLFSWMIYFFAFSPGIMTVDSQNQWAQVTGLRVLGQQHPLIHTFSIKILALIYPSPATFILFQILFGSLVISSILFFFYKEKVKLRVLSIISFLYALYPINGFYMSTLWKDIPFAVLFTLLVFILFRIYSTNGKWLNLKFNFVTLVVVCVLTSEYRKNAFPVIVLTLIVYFFVFKNLRLKMVITTFLLFCSFFSFSYVKNSVLHATESPATSAYAIPLQQIAYSYKYGNVPEKNKDFFEKILPEKDWKNGYNKYSVNGIKLNRNFDNKYFSENKSEFIINWSETLLKGNLIPYIKGFSYQTATLWRLYTPDDYLGYIVKIEPFPQDFTEENFTRYAVKNSQSKEKKLENLYATYKRNMEKANQSPVKSLSEYRQAYLKNEKLLRNSWYNNTLRKKFFDFHTWFMSEGQKIFGKGAFWVVLLIFLAIFSIFRLKKKSFILSLPSFLLIGTLFASIPATDFRYIYAISFSIPILSLALLYIASEKEALDG